MRRGLWKARKYLQALVSIREVATAAVLVVLMATVPAAGQRANTAYVLGPEDVLEISVWGYPDLTRLVAVRPDGRITLPLVGAVSVAGVSTEQLTRTLTRVYAGYIINPQVTVIVKEFRRIRVSILGQVFRPGSYVLPPGSRLLDLLSMGGGVTETAALKEGQLLRPGEQPVVVDLERVLAGDLQANVLLQGGETLVVREDLANLVNVFGEVARPGRYRLKGEMRLLDVLLAAGGLTDRASVKDARLVRATRESHALNLENLLVRQEMSHNVTLQAGDSLFIPEETNNKIYVLGDVGRPGIFILKGEVTVLQAVAMAGGPNQRGVASARTIHIVRRGGTEQHRLASAAKVESLPNGGALITLDLRALQAGDVKQDVTMKPGDVVVVPQSGLSGMQVILSILSGILGISWFFR